MTMSRHNDNDEIDSNPDEAQEENNHTNTVSPQYNFRVEDDIDKYVQEQCQYYDIWLQKQLPSNASVWNEDDPGSDCDSLVVHRELILRKRTNII